MQQTIQLVSGIGGIVDALLCSMEARHLDDYREVWQQILVEADQPDQGWPWDYKLRQAQQDERFEAYAVEADDFTQGLQRHKPRNAVASLGPTSALSVGLRSGDRLGSLEPN
jgi:hypothetical protein